SAIGSLPPATPKQPPGAARVLEPGSRFGRFSLHERLGEGGFAHIFRATLLPQGTTVALKIPKLPPFLATRDALARFEREGQILAALDHPGVVRVVGAGSEGGMPWVAL